MPRRRRKEHEPHHVGAGVQRDVERLARGQAANFDDQGHGFEHGLGDGDGTGTGRCACGRVLQRRALLVSPGGPVRAALRRAGRRCGSPREAGAGGPQIGQLRPGLPRIGLVPARGAPPVALPEPGRDAARQHAQDRHRDDDDEQRQRRPQATDRSELNGSNDTVTRCRLATANTTKIRPSGISTRAVKNFRMTLSRVDGKTRWRAVRQSADLAAGRRAIEALRLRRRHPELRLRGSAVRAFPCRS